MSNNFDPLTILMAPVSYTTLGGVNTSISNLPICVPTTLIPYRGRFCCIPEILKTIVGNGIRPTMLSHIDIAIEGKLNK